MKSSNKKLRRKIKKLKSHIQTLKDLAELQGCEVKSIKGAWVFVNRKGSEFEGRYNTLSKIVRQNGFEFTDEDGVISFIRPFNKEVCKDEIHETTES